MPVRTLRVLVLLTVFCGVLWILGLSGVLESLVFYFPSRAPFATPSGYEDVSIPTSDGLSLHGWYMPPAGRSEDDPPAPAVLHVHGNAGNIESHEAFSSFLPQHGIGVLIFDYRSYGRSDRSRGMLRRGDLMRDTRAALAYLRSRPDVDQGRIGVYGVSLGGVFALRAAAEDPSVRAVVCLAAFSSWKGIAQSHAGWIGRVLIGGGLDAEDAAARLGVRPLLIVHGRDDRTVPVVHAHRLADAARVSRANVQVYIAEDSGHNDLLWIDARVAPTIAEFLRRELGVNEGKGD